MDQTNSLHKNVFGHTIKWLSYTLMYKVASKTLRFLGY